MSKAPFMPLWVADFLGDTLDLDASEIGAYILLLMAQWQRDGASLPSDQKKLQRVARCGRNWPKVWVNLTKYFTQDNEGIYSKRLRLEAQNVALKREVNAHNGALGGTAKALKQKDLVLANANESLKRNPSIPEPELYKKEKAIAFLSFDNNEIAEAKAEISDAFSAYNIAAAQSGWPQVKVLSPARKSTLAARMRECGGISGWNVALSKAQASAHCCGQNERGWVANFDFLTRQSSFLKLMEGNYDNRPNGNAGSGRPTRAQFDTAHREYARRVSAGTIQRGPDPSDPFEGGRGLGDG